jgi:hypothetical protein
MVAYIPVSRGNSNQGSGSTQIHHTSKELSLAGQTLLRVRFQMVFLAQKWELKQEPL